MLSYRGETALQGALVLAKGGRQELWDNIFTDIIDLFNHRDIIGLQSNSVKKTQNKGYRMSVTINH